MATQRKIHEDLIPSWESLTSWQSCLLNAVEEIQANWKPYKRPGGSGCIATRTFRGSVIMRAADPPVSYCCGAQFEAFFLTWKEWLGAFFETSDDLTFAQMRKLYSYSFVYENIPNNEMGLAAPDALPSVMHWLPWLKEEGVSIETIHDPRQAQFGDFCQIQNGPKADQGHSVIVLGQGKWKGRDVLHVWSSNFNYDQKWPYSKGQKDGHGVDYYYIDRQVEQSDGSVWDRKFHLVRLSD